VKTFAIQDPTERKKFAIASYNAGEGRIAKAQQKAKENGKDPRKWDEVKQHLKSAGATDAKAKEVQDYVEKVLRYEEEFAKKSKADKSAKMDKAKKIKKLPEGGHWITLQGKHIFIEDK
jgi:membrane-bound lytic murein transglycosylase MltF